VGGLKILNAVDVTHYPLTAGGFEKAWQNNRVRACINCVSSVEICCSLLNQLLTVGIAEIYLL